MEPRELDPRTSAAPAAFDLNAAVAAGRAELAQVGLGAGELDELEDHLRAQHAELLATGLSADEAWLVASRRLGAPRELGREFGTLAAALPSPLLWMSIGGLALSVGGSAMQLTGILVRWATDSNLAAGLACSLLLASFLWMAVRWGSRALAHPVLVLAALLVAKAAWFAALFYLTRMLAIPDMAGVGLIGSLGVLALWSFAILGALGVLLAERIRRTRAKAA